MGSAPPCQLTTLLPYTDSTWLPGLNGWPDVFICALQSMTCVQSALLCLTGNSISCWWGVSSDQFYFCSFGDVPSKGIHTNTGWVVGGRISESSEYKLVETRLGGAGNVTLLPTYHTATDFSQTERNIKCGRCEGWKNQSKLLHHMLMLWAYLSPLSSKIVLWRNPLSHIKAGIIPL